jgi:hypothetical protein
MGLKQLFPQKLSSRINCILILYQLFLPNNNKGMLGTKCKVPLLSHPTRSVEVNHLMKRLKKKEVFKLQAGKDELHTTPARQTGVREHTSASD